MFLKLMALLMAFSFLTVNAGANNHEGLKAAFDEFNYATTVEWDQRDPSFLAAKQQELADAITAQGLSREELISVTRSLLNDKVLVKNLDRVLDAVSMNDMSAEQAQEAMAKAMKNSQMTGANWNGVIVLTPVGLLVLVLIVIIVT